jgi:FkbM family methyltransferase
MTVIEDDDNTATSAFGEAIRRSLRSNLTSRYVPRPFKFAWLWICMALLRRKFMRGYAPELASTYGFKLQGAVMDSTLNRIVFYRDLFEPSLSEIIASYLRPGDVCMDVGANTGYFTLLMAKIVGDQGKVIAVEASPGNVRHLHRNLAINRFANVEVHGVACGNVSGDTTFYVNERNDMHSRLVPPTSKRDLDYWLLGGRWNPVPVRIATLPEIAGDRAKDVVFLKVDIEGAEHLVAQTIVDTFTHPGLIVAIEAKQPEVMRTLKPFEEAGFHAYDLRNDYTWVVEQKYKAAMPVSFAELYSRRFMVDVVLARKPLDLGRS